MSDLISRQAAIDALKRAEALTRAFGYHNVIEAIRDLQSAQQWIPCSERLPEEDFWSGKERQFSNNVLVTIVNHAYDDEQVIDIAQTVDGIWKISHDVEGYYRLPSWCEVIAWMPLPPSYKGDKT